MKSINPFNNQIIKYYNEYTSEDIEKIIHNADLAQKQWKKTEFIERSEKMKTAAEILRKNKNQYAQMITMEMGKIIRESEAEIEKCAWVCDYYAENAEKFLANEHIKTDATKSYVCFQPLGIVLAIMPWNFPFWQVFRFAVPALMAGNGAVLKHASIVPGCALEIEKVFKEAGLPSDLFRSLLISSSKVQKIIKNPVIKAITLTGSEAAGSNVAEISGRNLKKSVLELGGSDPFIVMEDADIEECCKTAVIARMINCGQSCIAAKRFIVMESVASIFENRIKELLEKYRAGDPMEENTDIAPLAHPEFVHIIKGQVNRSLKMGAKLFTDNKKTNLDSNFYLPIIITDVQTEMPVFNEETFGPVFAVIRVKNEQEAIEVANKSKFGLGGCVWTKDSKRGENIASKVETGSMFVNGLTKSDPRLPFGGIKNSGYGRELSYYGIREFVNIKTIWIK